jgi:HPt (histidine-containing phosphotransfer) domain-containing protein
MSLTSDPAFNFLSVERGMEFIGDETGFLSLLKTLHKTLTSDIALISDLLARDDVPGANRLLHQVKGFAPVFCVDALVEHVVQVEVLSKHGDTAEVSEAFRKLAPQLEQLRNEVAAHLAANQQTLD